MRLRDALRIQRGELVAFVGAGGKTSALFRLAHELRDEGWRVLATTTTRLARSEMQHAPLAIQTTPTTSPSVIKQGLNEHGFVFLFGAEDIERDKIFGLPLNVITGLMDTVNSDVMLVEADGARRMPFKIPYDHEPVIPPDTSLVVPVAGVDALGQPLDEQHVYNATRLIERYGLPVGGTLVPAWMSLALRDPDMGLRGVPDSARVIVLLNKVVAASLYARGRARRVAQLTLRSPRIEAVLLGSMLDTGEPVCEVQRRVAAVVLAAGTSSRMGQSKPLLPWEDKHTVIETIVHRLITARVAEIVVVTGHRGDDVAQALASMPVKIVHNPDYEQGEMLSSLQVALRALPGTTAACLVVMGDQPMLDPRVLSHILTAYAEKKGEIIAPVYRGQRGHPVLIDRRFWPDLLELESGAPRDIIRRYPDQLALIETQTDSILRDIDTPEQYRLERRRAGLD